MCEWSFKEIFPFTNLFNLFAYYFQFDLLEILHLNSDYKVRHIADPIQQLKLSVELEVPTMRLHALRKATPNQYMKCS